MGMYVCEQCKNDIEHLEEMIACPNCGKYYHKECWVKSGNCVLCEKSTKIESTKEAENLNEKDELSSDGMFANIGEKLKKLAIVVTILGIIEGFVVFMATAAINEELAFQGLLLGVAIGFWSWGSSFTLYGFGSLVSSMQNTEKLLTEVLDEIKNKE